MTVKQTGIAGLILTAAIVVLMLQGEGMFALILALVWLCLVMWMVLS